MKEMLSNKILTALPDAEFVRLMPLLEPVSLATGECLADTGEKARFLYFPESAIISCQADMQDGKTAEIGMIGKDGLAGLPSLLGARPAAHSLNVTIAGSALRVRKEQLERELESNAGLRQAIFAYVGEYLTQVCQRSACATLHRLEQRLAVWLLLLAERLDTDSVEITQERIAHHLGARRAGVTVVAREMQDLGAIRYSRGNLRFQDRQALAAMACECYGVITGARQQTTSI